MAIEAETQKRNTDARLVRVRDVAALLKTSERFIWKCVATGRMPAPLRLGRAVRFDRHVLEAWIDDGCPPVDQSRAEQGARR